MLDRKEKKKRKKIEENERSFRFFSLILKSLIDDLINLGVCTSMSSDISCDLDTMGNMSLLSLFLTLIDVNERWI